VLRSIVARSGKRGRPSYWGPRPETSSVRVLNPLRGEILIELTPFVTSEVAGLPGYDLLVHWFREDPGELPGR
jgi:hypothetical protein